MTQDTRGQRQRGRTEPLETISFRLRASVVRAIRLAVKVGEAPNASAFIEDIVKERLRARRRERVYAAYADAAQDPVFMDEMAHLLD